MGTSLLVALRYLRAKKRASVSVGTLFSTLGVTLGVAALAIVMSVTGGFKQQFRDKVLGVNAHVLVLKYASDFRDYRDIMEKASKVEGVVGVAPFIINPMMVTHGQRTATGVLLKGVDPELMPKVLDLPKHIVEGSLVGLRKPGAAPPPERDGDLPTRTIPAAPAPSGSAGPNEERSFLRTLQDEVAREADAGAQEEAAEAALPVAVPTPIPVEAPREIEPQGGYTSSLPSDDVLPAEIDPDPCTSPERVKELPGLVIGTALGKQLAAKIGDCVQITSPTVGLTFSSSGGRAPIAKQFRVIALFSAGFDQYDSKLVYTDLYEAEAFYDQGDSVTGVEMKVDDIDRAQPIAREIDGILQNSLYHTMDWMELNRSLFTALLIQQLGMSFVLALIIVVAAFTVVATLIMVVLEKKKEIALLKALGAKDASILRIFLFQGGITGTVGTAAGLLLGYLGCKAIGSIDFPLDPKVYFISKLPVSIRPQEFLITGAVALVICLLATITPALYAAWLRPSDGLRAD
ncbi:MAG: ABC transporter permease [Proteobacteria bacterium]|nr:MAG: ABC transporter permease [Pseudomonadota bacterium]